MIRKYAFALACAATATTVLGLTAAPAGAISLGELIRDNGTLTFGDKEFSNFFFQAACLPGPCPTKDDVDNPFSPVDPFSINVGSATTPHGPGLKFNDFWQAKDGYGIDNVIEYTVKVLDPSKLIHDIHLEIDPIIGEGTVKVVETVSKPGGLDIGQVVATNESLLTTKAWVNLTENVKEVRVRKDIQLLGTNGKTAHFTTMDQEFSQVSVPEPGSVGGLLVFGSFGIGLMLKRRQQSNKLALSATPNESSN